MSVEVKICGITTEPAMEAALAGGADYVGLVFFPPSPRDVSLDVAKTLAAKARGRARIVALMVDADNALIADVIAAADPDILQLHGTESPERVEDVRRRWSKPVMKAIHVETAADVAGADAYRRAAELILFDARAPRGSTRPGGNGAAFDWQALTAAKGQFRYMLSGGLTPENVAHAIEITGAPMVDVSSGVEIRPGEKDSAMIERFLRAAKQDRQTRA